MDHCNSEQRLATALMTCSQLSSTARARLSRSQAANPDTGLPAGKVIPNSAANALATCSGSATEASPTNQTPSA